MIQHNDRSETTPMEVPMHEQPPPPYAQTPVVSPGTSVPISQARLPTQMPPAQYHQATQYQMPTPQQYRSPPYPSSKPQQSQSLEAKGAVLAQQLLPPILFEKLSSIPQVQRYTQPIAAHTVLSQPFQPPAATTIPYAPNSDPYSGSYPHPSPQAGSTPGILPPPSSLLTQPPNPPPFQTLIKELHITTTATSSAYTTSNSDTFFITAPGPSPTSQPTILYTITRPPSHPPELAFHRGSPLRSGPSTIPTSTADLATTNEIICTITKFHPYALTPSTDLLLHGHPATLKGVKKLGSGKVREVESQAGLGVIEWKDCGVGVGIGKKHMEGWLVASSRDGSGRRDIAWVHPRRWDTKVKDATIVLAEPWLQGMALDEVIVTAVAMMEALRREKKVKGESEGWGGVGYAVGAVLGG